MVARISIIDRSLFVRLSVIETIAGLTRGVSINVDDIDDVRSASGRRAADESMADVRLGLAGGAPLGRFYTVGRWPLRDGGRALIALHGVRPRFVRIDVSSPRHHWRRLLLSTRAPEADAAMIRRHMDR